MFRRALLCLRPSQVADGKPQNIGAHNRFVTGTWSAGNEKAEFKVVRN
jgi:hypothetical protein